MRYITTTTVILKKMVRASEQTFEFYSICSQFSDCGHGKNSLNCTSRWIRKERNIKRLWSRPPCQNTNSCVSESSTGGIYLNAVHIFQQLLEGVDVQQGDNIPDGGRLSRSRFIHNRTQHGEFKVAVFLRQTAWKWNKQTETWDIIYF